MEYWNDGIMGQKLPLKSETFFLANIPLFHHSIFPFFFYFNGQRPFSCSTSRKTFRAEFMTGTPP